jgi:hypothetical protein
MDGSTIKILPTICIEYTCDQKHLKNGAESCTRTNVSHNMQFPRTRPTTLGDRMNLHPLTKPNPHRQSVIGEGFPADRCREV